MNQKYSLLLWVLIAKVIDSYFTLLVLATTPGTIELNLLYNMTSLSASTVLWLTVPLSVLLTYIFYKKDRVIAEALALTVSVFAIVNVVSFFSLGLGVILQRVQFVVILTYMMILWVNRTDEGLEPLFLN